MSRLLHRAKKALINPAYVIDLVSEKILTAFWTLSFRIQCHIRGVSIGKQLEIFGRCIIRKNPGSKIRLGNHVQIISSAWRSSTANCTNSKLRTFYPSAEIIMEDHSGMTGGVIVARSKKITIGRHCMLAPNVVILDSDFHLLWPPDRRHNTWETDIDRDVTLEPNVWVGIGSIILKGVTIGENSVIAAGSVVTSNIPSNCLAGGNPAKVLRKLDSDAGVATEASIEKQVRA
jgi:acetyltransferase-like isoleucine patch superfamily enzyme